MDRSSFTEKKKTEPTARYSSLLTCKCRFYLQSRHLRGDIRGRTRRYGAMELYLVRVLSIKIVRIWCILRIFSACVPCGKLLREFVFYLTVSWNIHAALSLPLYFCLDRGIVMYNTRPETEHAAPVS